MKKKIINTTVVAHILIPGIILAILLVVINTSDVIQIKGLSPYTVLAGDNESSGPLSPTQENMMQVCQTIAQYYFENGYEYDNSSEEWTIDYLQQTRKGSCCTIYVAQVLYQVGLIREDEFHSVWMSAEFGNWLNANPDWDEVPKGDKLKAGDIQIYTNGCSHVNMFSGEYTEDGQELFWDAGSPSASNGAFIGETKTHGSDGLTCSYRYNK